MNKKIKLTMLGLSIGFLSGYFFYESYQNKINTEKIEIINKSNLKIKLTNDISKINEMLDLEINNQQYDKLSNLMIEFIDKDKENINIWKNELKTFNEKIGNTVQEKNIVDYLFNYKYIYFDNKKINESELYNIKREINKKYILNKMIELKKLSDNIEKILTSSQLTLIKDYQSDMVEKINSDNLNVNEIDINNYINKIRMKNIKLKENEFYISDYFYKKDRQLNNVLDDLNQSISEILSEEKISMIKISEINKFIKENVENKMKNETKLSISDTLLNNDSYILNPYFYLSSDKFYNIRSSIDEKTINLMSKIIFSDEYVYPNIKNIMIDEIDYNRSINNEIFINNVNNKIKEILGEEDFNKTWNRINEYFNQDVDVSKLENFMNEYHDDNQKYIDFYSNISKIKSVFNQIDYNQNLIKHENKLTILTK